MIARAACGLTVCLLWSFLIVCSANAETFRGQNPADYAVARPVPVQPLSAVYPPGYRVRGVRRAGSPQQGHSYPVRQASVSPHAMPVRHYNQEHQQGTVVYGEPHAGASSSSHGSVYEPGWEPTHRHFSTYDPPNNLTYPPAQVPAGFVQYPYYTIKGPSDFFMK